MGTLGIPEMMFIFTLALLLFGPKKLPELGRTVGKALAEFRRAQSELKATFDREMKNLERESESLKEATNNYYQDSYNYDHSYDQSSYDAASHDSGNPYESHDSTATDSTTESASATLGAESTTATLHLTGEPPEGTVASGSYNYHYDESGSYESAHQENGYQTSSSALAQESTIPPAPSGPIHDLAPQHHAGESSSAETTVKS